MKNSYIFLQKKKNLVYNNFSEYIKSECKPDSTNVFKFEYNFKTYKLKYNEKEEKNNLEEKIIYVEIEIEGEDKKSAEILGYFESKFKSDGNLMKSFGIVNSYYQVSLYYINILYS